MAREQQAKKLEEMLESAKDAGEESMPAHENETPTFTRVRIHSQYVYFCKYCHEAVKQNQKCDYCYQVYMDGANDALGDGKEWIGCDSCGKWNHTDCEIDEGQDEELRKVAIEEKKRHDAEIQKIAERQESGQAADQQLSEES